MEIIFGVILGAGSVLLGQYIGGRKPLNPQLKGRFDPTPFSIPEPLDEVPPHIKRRRFNAEDNARKKDVEREAEERRHS